jgi:hypothetical protein
MNQYKTQRAARKAWKKEVKKLEGSGKIFHVKIAHDEWCGIYSQNECNCNPDRTLMDEKGKTIVKILGAGFYDPLDL